MTLVLLNHLFLLLSQVTWHKKIVIV